MTQRDRSASTWLASCPATVISAFHSVQPRPRAQVASSTSMAARNASRLSPWKNVQAIARSQEGSPIPEVPKSMTALRRPFWTRRLPQATSPWNQTGDPCQVAARAAYQTAVAAWVSICPSSAWSASLVWLSYTLSDPPRKKLCWPAGGPPAGSIRRSAMRNLARSTANCRRSAISAVLAVSPSIQR